MFKFPASEKERQKWINVISQYRRKGSGDTFDPWDRTKRYFVCEFHFKGEEMRVSLGIGRKTLKPGVVPNIFKFKNPNMIKPRKSPKKQELLPEKNNLQKEYSSEEDLETANPNDILRMEPSPEPQRVFTDEIALLKERIRTLEIENDSLKSENMNLKSTPLFNYESISQDKKHFKKVRA